MADDPMATTADIKPSADKWSWEMLMNYSVIAEQIFEIRMNFLLSVNLNQ